MAIETREPGFVLLVALFAVEFSVFARMPGHFCALFRVTGQTGILDQFGLTVIDIQRCMRIVTRGTVLNPIMRTQGAAMTFGTARDHPFRSRRMSLMAINAGHAVFMCFAFFRNQGDHVVMATGTEVRGDFGTVMDSGGLVRIVALQAFLISHFRSMPFVASKAIDKFTMDRMALIAIHFRMSTGDRFELFTRFRVTGQAGRLDVLQPQQVSDFRGMWFVTAGA